MRKEKKRQIENFLKTLEEVHRQIQKAIEWENISMALRLLKECQENVIELGKIIEQSEKDSAMTIQTLEQYCEKAYQLYEEILSDKLSNSNKVYKALHSFLIKIENSVRNDIETRLEIVFLPYKASMWDSFESIWKAANESAECDVYVIPIPYYSKNPDGSPRKIYFEGGRYPDDVIITYYEDYDFEEHRPDMIFIHNPYDDSNLVTSVLPRFYAHNLKKYTDNLVYVPYFVVPWSIPEHFVLTPGVVFSDFVFVQSSLIREQYIKILEKEIFPDRRKELEKKVISLGSPKTDKIFLMQGESKKQIPDEWRKKIGNKKVVFFNTNVSLLLNNKAYFVDNLNRIFQIFEKYKNEFVLLWREHPLTMETLHSMRPGLLKKYLKIKEEFVKQEWGILDTSEEPHLAMALSDCYFGAGGSLVTIYSVIGKPDT